METQSKKFADLMANATGGESVLTQQIKAAVLVKAYELGKASRGEAACQRPDVMRLREVFNPSGVMGGGLPVFKAYNLGALEASAAA